jgi:hypothetical protein
VLASKKNARNFQKALDKVFKKVVFSKGLFICNLQRFKLLLLFIEGQAGRHVRQRYLATRPASVFLYKRYSLCKKTDAWH